MSLFFNLSDAIAFVGSKDDRHPVTEMILLEPTMAAIAQSPSLILMFENKARLLDFSAPHAAVALAKLISDTKLYRLCLELCLDGVLNSAREKNDEALRTALKTAFGERGLPIPHGNVLDVTAGELKHPLLGHISHDEIAEIYTRLVQAFPSDRHAAHHGLQTVVALNREPFFKDFDGICQRGRARVRFDLLLKDARTVERSPFTDVDLAPQSTAQALNSWLKLDRVLYLRVHDLLFVLNALDQVPNWVSSEFEQLQTIEKTKVTLAKIFSSFHDAQVMLGRTSLLKDALDLSKSGNIDPLITDLASALQSPDPLPARIIMEKMQENTRRRQLEAELVPGLAA